MTKQTIIEIIAQSCNISLENARLNLEANLEYLQQLRDDNDLQYSDIIQVCQDLGLETDFYAYILELLTF